MGSVLINNRPRYFQGYRADETTHTVLINTTGHRANFLDVDVFVNNIIVETGRHIDRQAWSGFNTVVNAGDSVLIELEAYDYAGRHSLAQSPFGPRGEEWF